MFKNLSNHWDDWCRAIISHIWTISFILVEWSNSWAFPLIANIFFLTDKLNRHNNDSEIKSQNTQKLARNIVKTCCFWFTKFRCLVLFTGRGAYKEQFEGWLKSGKNYYIFFSICFVIASLRIDKGASKRFVKSALWNPSGNYRKFTVIVTHAFCACVVLKVE